MKFIFKNNTVISRYTGRRCDLSMCNDFCPKYQQCVLSSTRPTCKCPPGYSGDKCEISNVCNNYCHNGGTCIPGQQPICKCSRRYTGKFCNIDLCLSSNPPLCKRPLLIRITE